MNPGQAFSFNYIGDRLREMRKREGWSQRELIEHIRWRPETVTSVSYVSDIETGRTLPSLEALAALCSAFNLGLAAFFGGAGHEQPDNKVLSLVIRHQAAHAHLWRDRDDNYWLQRLMTEVGEASGVLALDHDDTLEHELTQIASIAISWLQLLAERGK